MAAHLIGEIKWSIQQSAEGYRDYTLKSLVQTDSDDDGPKSVLSCPDLHSFGEAWDFGGEEEDIFVYCSGEASAEQRLDGGEKTNFWVVEQKFTNRPLTQQTAFDNPLDQPPKISGTFSKFTKQTSVDKDGKFVCNSSYQPYQIEREFSRPTINIELFLPALPLVAISGSTDYVNGVGIWGLAARTVKLSSTSWEKLYHQSVGFYYSVKYGFEVCGDTWDYKEWDYGTKVLKPGGTSTNPKDYRTYQDDDGNPSATLLDGSGAALTAGGSPILKTFKVYPEADFVVALGVPDTL